MDTIVNQSEKFLVLSLDRYKSLKVLLVRPSQKMIS